MCYVGIDFLFLYTLQKSGKTIYRVFPYICISLYITLDLKACVHDSRDLSHTKKELINCRIVTFTM